MTDKEIIKLVFPDKNVSENVANLAIISFRLGELSQSEENKRLQGIIERAKKNLNMLDVRSPYVLSILSEAEER